MIINIIINITTCSKDNYKYNLDLIFGAFAIIPTKDDEVKKHFHCLKKA